MTKLDDNVRTTIDAVRLRVDRIHKPSFTTPRSALGGASSTGAKNTARITGGATCGPSTAAYGIVAQHRCEGGFWARGARKSDGMFSTFASGGCDGHRPQAPTMSAFPCAAWLHYPRRSWHVFAASWQISSRKSSPHPPPTYVPLLLSRLTENPPQTVQRFNVRHEVGFVLPNLTSSAYECFNLLFLRPCYHCCFYVLLLFTDTCNVSHFFCFVCK